MNSYIADTMALILRLEKRRMPQKAKDIFNDGENGKVQIQIPAIVFAEIAYLSEKRKIEANLIDVRRYINNNLTIMECPMTLTIVEQAFLINDIPELHDRLIAASGKNINATVITNDPLIEKSVHVKTIWK